MSGNKFGEAWEEQETSIKWRDDMVFKLISLRQKYNNVFSGKRGSARDGWTMIGSELGLLEHSYKVLQKKWQNLVQKYKEVKCPANHSNPDVPITTTWIFYHAMDQFLGDSEVSNNLLFDTPRTVHQVQTSDSETKQIIDFDFSDISLVQDSSEQPFKKKKISHGFEAQEDPTSSHSIQYVESSEPPQWFRDFLTTYRQDEAKRMEALKSMHYDIMRLERKKCSLLQHLISKLSADEDDINDPPSPSNLSKMDTGGGTGILDQPTTTLTVTVNQSGKSKVGQSLTEQDDESDLGVQDTQIIIRPEGDTATGIVTGTTTDSETFTFSQSTVGTKAQALASKAVLTGPPVKLVVAGHPGSLKGSQQLFMKSTSPRGKLVVPMRKIMIPVSETSSSVRLGSTDNVLTDSVLTESVIASAGYQCIDASDSS